MLSSRAVRLILCLFLLSAASAGAWTGLVDFSTGLMDYAAKRFGWQAAGRLQTMQNAVRNIKTNSQIDFKLGGI